MTEQKPHKWHDLIVAWAGGAKVECRRMVFQRWHVFTIGGNPNWDDPDWEFRLHDPYREVAEAMKRGELCQYRFGNEWFDATGTLSDYLVSRRKGGKAIRDQAKSAAAVMLPSVAADNTTEAGIASGPLP